MYDHRPLALLNHVRKDSHRRREAGVSVREDVFDGLTALAPIHVRGRMDRLLDVRAVEVDGGLRLRLCYVGVNRGAYDRP